MVPAELRPKNSAGQWSDAGCEEKDLRTQPGLANRDDARTGGGGIDDDHVVGCTFDPGAGIPKGESGAVGNGDECGPRIDAEAEDLLEIRMPVRPASVVLAEGMLDDPPVDGAIRVVVDVIGIEAEFLP